MKVKASYFLEQGRKTNGTNLPKMSTALDSVRAFEWEIRFHNLPNGVENGLEALPLTIAAKSVSQTGFESQTIEVRKGNDKYNYPGYVDMTELVVQFDNQYITKMHRSLYTFMQSTYDPLTGEFTKNQGAGLAPNHKTMIDVVQFDGKGKVVSNTRYIGAYIKSWKPTELNYDTNAFHTIECTFVYDFVAATDLIPK